MPSFSLSFASPCSRAAGVRQCSPAARCCSHAVSWQAEESRLEQDGQLRMFGGTQSRCSCSTELPDFGAFRFTALMQH